MAAKLQIVSTQTISTLLGSEGKRKIPQGLDIPGNKYFFLIQNHTLLGLQTYPVLEYT